MLATHPHLIYNQVTPEQQSFLNNTNQITQKGKNVQTETTKNFITE